MKITMVNGQNHKGSTYQIGRKLADKLCDGDEIQEVFLPRDFSSFCCGCTNCFMKEDDLCPHFEKLRPITEKIDEADFLIFTSPVYVYHVTAPMKNLLDHYGYRWIVHRPSPEMFHKQAAIIATAAGGGMKSTCKDMKDSLFFWGISRIYSLGVAVRAVSYEQIPVKRLAKIEKKILRIEKKARKNIGKIPGIKTRLWFFAMSKVQKKGWNDRDALYWKEQRWTEGKRPWSSK